ncbi:MAG: HAMP domain-containing protein [Myxococcales bacterium]|nr:HAMP domain-containing protein [Myxococcales bacterium]
MATLLVVAAVPLGALTATSLRAQRQGLAQAEKELEIAILDRASETLLRDLDYASEATLRVGRVLTEPSITDTDAKITLGREIMARASALAHLAVYTPDGARVDTLFRANETREPLPLEQLPEFLRQAPPREGRWLPATFGPWGVALRFAVPLERGGAVVAWVVGTVQPRWLDATLAALSQERLGHEDRVLLIDDQLRLLSRGPGLPVGASLAGRDLLTGLSLPRQAFSQRLELTNEFTTTEPHIGTLRILPEHRWAVIVRRPEAEAFRALRGAQRVLIAGALVTLLFVAALGAWLGSRAVAPVLALMALTRAYARRVFGERSTVRTGDELEALGRAMEAMADEIVAGEAEIARRTRVEGDLSRFLPAEVAGRVARGEATLSLGGARREVTVLFADVVAFTSFAESAPPEKVVAFLNELFTVLTEVVFRHQGMVDKFVGDCVMAVFGAGDETALEAQVARALSAAEDMHRFVEASAPEWFERYGFEVKLGIGVNTGEALVGNLGSETRMEFTAIGDAVNVAARLEALARGAQTLVTARVSQLASADGFTFHPLGHHPLRGKRESVEIFEVVM